MFSRRLVLLIFVSVFLHFTTAMEVRSADYVVFSWNDLGMHCYNADFKNLAVLPPYNTLWAQVVKIGNPPQIITDGITVQYSFPDNTYSAGKSNFWNYEDKLFGVDLPDNVGLTGKGLSGNMDRHGDYFIAEGIPLTEFRDSNLKDSYPYQLARIVVRNSVSGVTLATLQVVAPVSSEMHCDSCHYDGGVEDIATGNVETNILTLHDEENSDEYPPGHTGDLMGRRPVLCAECHASNALGAAGIVDIPSLSNAIHEQHADEIPDTTVGCYSCHPGPDTKCLRGVMGSSKGMGCVDCHGGMESVAENPKPWLKEPRCDTASCHGSGYEQDQPLYRFSKGHGGIYCAGCHDSPHAIAPSSEHNDTLKFKALQGDSGPLVTCTICHLEAPDKPGPHGIRAKDRDSKAAVLPFGVYFKLLDSRE